ncbi:MAG: glycosyltransferase family 4 protein [Rhodanobacteraceae bacterium]
MLQPLDEALPEARFFLYGRQNFDCGLPSARWFVRRDAHPVYSVLPTPMWIHYRLGALVRSDGLDVFWASNTLLPSRIGKLPCVATVYDLNHLLFPQTMAPLTRAAHRHWFAADVLAAKRVITISEGTAHRLHALLGRRADAVALPAVPPRRPLPDQATARALLHQLGIRGPYVLTVGTREPRKNLKGAISAVAMLKSRGRLMEHELVMVGAQGWGKTDSTASRNSDSDWLRPVGYVDDVTLATLYTNAEALLFPSVYEGYGIPLGEALSYGCRVVATDLPELRESGGDGVVYVASTPVAIAQGLECALAEPPPVPRQPLHSWSDAAFVMATIFREIASTPTTQP